MIFTGRPLPHPKPSWAKIASNIGNSFADSAHGKDLPGFRGPQFVAIASPPADVSRVCKRRLRLPLFTVVKDIRSHVCARRRPTHFDVASLRVADGRDLDSIELLSRRERRATTDAAAIPRSLLCPTAVVARRHRMNPRRTPR